MKRKKVDTLMRKLCMVLSGTVACMSVTGCAVETASSVSAQTGEAETETEAESEKGMSLSKRYIAALSAEIKTDIYNELDGYLTTYTTNTDISQYFNEDTVSNITQTVIAAITPQIETMVGEAETTLSDEQKEIITKMIASAIDEIDFDEIYASQTAELTEVQKAQIVNEVDNKVQEILSGMSFTTDITYDQVLLIQSAIQENLWADMQSYVEQAISNVGGDVTVTEYTLTDTDRESIKNAVLASLDLSNLPGNGPAIDPEQLNSMIADAVASQIETLVANGLKGADGADGKDGVDGYTPVKGVDYFTEKETQIIIDDIASRVQAGVDGKDGKDGKDGENGKDGRDGIDGKDGYTPVKGTDYFTEEEVAAIMDTIASNVQAGVDGKDGKDGINGKDGKDGTNGVDGKDGYTPVKGVDYYTEDEVNAIVADITEKVVKGTDGKDGKDGLSAYELAVEEGFSGTRAEWLNSLRGEDGKDGANGKDGYTPVKGIDYFTEDEVKALAENVTSIVKMNYDTVVADLQEQIAQTDETIAGLNDSIVVLQDNLKTQSEQIAELSEKSDSSDTEINDILAEMETTKTQIQSIQDKVITLSDSKLDISTYETYTAATKETLTGLAEADVSISDKVSTLETSVNETFERIDEALSKCSTSEELDAFKMAYDSFKADTLDTLDGLKTTCETLENTKVGKADFEAFQAEEQEALTALNEALTENSLLVGDTDFETEDYSTITDALVSIQTQVDNFYDEYGTALADVSNDIYSIQTTIGTKADGSVYEDYAGSLWQAAAELKTAIDVLEGATDESDAAIYDMIATLNTELSDYEDATNAALSEINTDISNLNATLATKLDTKVFAAYQTDIDSKLLTLKSAIDTLDISLEEEAAARANADSEEAMQREEADAALSANVEEEANSRKEADDAISDALDIEKTEREEADAINSAAISKEAEERAIEDEKLAVKDTALNERINTETEERIAADEKEAMDRDTAINDAIAQEVIDRDAAIAVETQNRIDATTDATNLIVNLLEQEKTDREATLLAEQKAREEAIADTNSALEKEIADRNTAIETEINAREEAVTTLRDLLDKEIEDRTTALNNAIAKEIIDRNDAIQNAVSTEQAERIAADEKEASDRTTAINDAISQEIADRDAAIAVETKNRTDADAKEVADRNTAINNAINKEVVDRNTAIKTAVDKEQSAREEADSAIKDSLATETTDRKAADEKEAKDRDAAISAEAKSRQEADAKEVTDRNTAINSAINKEVTDRDAAIKKAVDKEAADRNTAIAAETAARESSIALISDLLAQEVIDRQTAIDNAISTEVKNRNNAINTAVTAEETARKAADTKEVTDRNKAISDSVNAEKTAREAADAKEVTDRNTAINNAISKEVKDRNTAISNEKTERLAAEKEISDNLATEITDRTTADTALGGRVDKEISDRKTADTTLDGKVSTETKNRTDADTALGKRIDTETSERKAADSATDTALATETKNRTDADTTLTGKINTEISDRKTADTTESTARANADTALGKRVDTETTNRTTEDTSLSNRMVAYGTCSTAAGTAAKVVAATGYKLVTGASIRVKFTAANTAANPTLNVASTGAKPIYYGGAALAANALKANRTYEFLYNGTQYEFVGDIETNIDTKNTTGTTNKTGTKLFLAGGTSQADNGVTYSNSNVYVGTDNALYSNGKKVLNADEKNATISGSLANQIKQLQDSWETFQGTSTLTLADIEQKFADLDAEIDELNTKLNPNTFIPVTPASPDVTIVQGGYIKVGKIVFVSINLRTSVVVSGNIICKGLPIPLINAYVPLSGINTSSGNIPFTYVNQNGELASVTEANKGFVVTGAYICK